MTPPSLLLCVDEADAQVLGRFSTSLKSLASPVPTRLSRLNDSTLAIGVGVFVIVVWPLTFWDLGSLGLEKHLA
jgi:hypothetical protein